MKRESSLPGCSFFGQLCSFCDHTLLVLTSEGRLLGTIFCHHGITEINGRRYFQVGRVSPRLKEVLCNRENEEEGGRLETPWGSSGFLVEHHGMREPGTESPTTHHHLEPTNCPPSQPTHHRKMANTNLPEPWAGPGR